MSQNSLALDPHPCRPSAEAEHVDTLMKGIKGRGHGENKVGEVRRSEGQTCVAPSGVCSPSRTCQPTYVFSDY